MDHHTDDHDRGLQFDVSTLLRRRGLLGLLAGAGLAAVAGCDSPRNGSGPTGTGGSGPGAATASPSAGGPAGGTAGGATGGSAEIPQETAGPFPADGSNGPNILTRSGIVRRDIRRSFGTASGVATGVPLTINLTVVDAARGGAAFAGAAVYVWQCDINAGYSMYSRGLTGENYLRGVQPADRTGAVTFTSVFPAAYAGRWPHVHFEVYPSLAAATSASNKITTSQLALPEAACRAVYATAGYQASVRNLAGTSLRDDLVFADGVDRQLATVTGNVSSGYVAKLVVPVAV